jgi:hypothetical protein
MLTNIEKVGSIAGIIIDSKTEVWGIKVSSVEIRELPYSKLFNMPYQDKPKPKGKEEQE